MQYTLPSLFAVALLGFAAPNLNAQTVAGFEEQILLPESDFASTQLIESSYIFESGLIRFFGETTAWGTYTNFNFSNVTDTLTTNNDLSAITGTGANGSAQFGVCYVNIDFMGPNPSATIPSSAKLLAGAAGKSVSGLYVTNSTYAYHYTSLPSFVNGNHWFMLTIKGYLNGLPLPDSVNFMLADYRNGQNLNVKTWEWVDLSHLGNVDSLTFDLSSDDAGPYGINVPAYFALDNLITLEDSCLAVQNLMLDAKTEHSASFSWNAAPTDFFELAIDTSHTLAPSVPPVLVTGNSFDAIDLESSTNYVLHLRSLCSDSTYSNWDTLSFVTNQPSSISSLTTNELQIQISPNPTHSILNIESEKELEIRVYNYLGQEVFHAKAKKNLNVEHLPNGMYILNAMDPKSQKTSSLKFIKY